MHHINIKYVFLTVAAVLFFCGFSGTGFAQTAEYQINKARLNTFIKQVEAKSEETKMVAMNEYQSNFRRIIEYENQNKTGSEVYEEFCVKNDKSLCRIVLVEKMVSPYLPEKLKGLGKKWLKL